MTTLIFGAGYWGLMRRQVPSEVKNGRVLVVGGQVCLFAGSVLFRSKFFAFDHFKQELTIEVFMQTQGPIRNLKSV